MTRLWAWWRRLIHPVREAPPLPECCYRAMSEDTLQEVEIRADRLSERYRELLEHERAAVGQRLTDWELEVLQRRPGRA